MGQQTRHSLRLMDVTLATSHVETSPVLQTAPLGHDCATVQCASRFFVHISRNMRDRILVSILVVAPAATSLVLLNFLFLFILILCLLFLFVWCRCCCGDRGARCTASTSRFFLFFILLWFAFVCAERRATCGGDGCATLEDNECATVVCKAASAGQVCL